MEQPIIGITMNERDDLLYVKDLYIEKVIRAGGYPVLLSSQLDEKIVHKIDGLLLTGGGDIAPDLFGEGPHPKLGRITPRRDQFELALTKAMLREDKPILAICRGMQLLNIAAGGTMIQHIDPMHAQFIQHDQQAPSSFRSHAIEIDGRSQLYTLIGEDKMMVNSFHHQAVRHVPAPLKVSARAKDGVIEAIESSRHRFAMGVQWHPECLQGKDSDALFLSFIAESRKTNESN